MRGVDISNWQAGIVPSSLGVDFCIVKATEGLGYTDPCCDGFVQDCINNGILFGFYHFARENEPEAEAEFFYDECSGYIGRGIPVLDYETENYSNSEWCERFIQRFYELSDIWCILYISAYRCGQYQNSWIPERCGLWVAGYPWNNPNWTDEELPYDVTPWEFAAIWQFTSSLRLPEWGGNLDGNIAYMTADAWHKYANTVTPSPSPAPVPTPTNIDDIVRDVLAGNYGNGEERIKALGNNYEAVQARINQLYNIADDVINGDWGNGWNREQALNAAGYPYDIVQSIVNDKLN